MEHSVFQFLIRYYKYKNPILASELEVRFNSSLGIINTTMLVQGKNPSTRFNSSLGIINQHIFYLSENN